MGVRFPLPAPVKTAPKLAANTKGELLRFLDSETYSQGRIQAVQAVNALITQTYQLCLPPFHAQDERDRRASTMLPETR